MSIVSHVPTGFEHLSPAWFHLSHAHIVRGEGIYLYDDSGARWTDFTSGIGVTNTGHCHPRVVQTIQEQASRLIFGQMNCVIPDAGLQLAATLREVIPAPLHSFFYSNSGAEAVEAAVKLARHATGKPNLIAFQGGFHGRTAMAMALTASKTGYRAGYQPLPSGIFFAPFPYAYHYGWDEETTIRFCLNELEGMLKAQTAPDETAALLLEPVLGEGGYVPAPPRFLQGLRDLCDRHGLLLILDEIQSGCGRTGDMWAHTRSGILPDILIAAKGIASGMPFSLIAASPDLMSRWKTGAHGGTYGGGNAVVLAAANTTLTVLQDEGLIDNAARMGAYLQDRLRTLQQHYDVMGDVRGVGLMQAVEFRRGREAAADVCASVRKHCIDQRLLLLSCGTLDNTIRWIPPLLVTKEQLDDAVQIFEQAMAAAVN